MVRPVKPLPGPRVSANDPPSRHRRTSPMKSLFETLAALSAGAALLAGCGGASAPVNAAEVPASVEVKPAAAAPAAPAPAANAVAAPVAAAATAAAPAAAPPAAKPAAKTGRRVAGKK